MPTPSPIPSRYGRGIVLPVHPGRSPSPPLRSPFAAPIRESYGRWPQDPPGMPPPAPRTPRSRRHLATAISRPHRSDSGHAPAIRTRRCRRRLSGGASPPAYRLRILKEVDACKRPGEVGALLRREGLYSSLLTNWRRQREAGALQAMRGRRRGPTPRPVDPRVKQLEAENRRLQRKLQRAETIITLQKKVAEILRIPLKPLDIDETD